MERKTVHKVEGGLQMLKPNLSLRTGCFKVFEGSSSANLRLVSLKKDRMADGLATVIQAHPGLPLC